MADRVDEITPEEEEPNFGQVFKDAASFWTQKPPEQQKGARPTSTNVDFSKPWKKSDAILTVDNNQKFHVHSGILARLSPIFEEMLDPDKLLRLPNREVFLAGKNADEFREFLKVLYTGEQVREYKINFLLPLAHEFKTLVVLKRCEESLIPKVTNDTLAYKYLSIAHRFSLEGLRRTCVQLLKVKPFKELRGNRMYQELAPACGWNVMEAKAELVEQELGRFKTKLEVICEEMIGNLFGELYSKQSGGKPPPMNAAMGNKICFIKEAGAKSEEMKIVAETIEKLEKLYS